MDPRAVRTLYRRGNSVTPKRLEPPITWPSKLQPRQYILNICSVSLLCLIYTSAYVGFEAFTMDVAQINLVVITP
jgi:hypothetical protein